jgi:hypothetical protein
MTDNHKTRAWRFAAWVLEHDSDKRLRDEPSDYDREALEHIRDAVVPSLRRRAEIIERRKSGPR